MGWRLRNTLPISKQLLELAVSTRTKEITCNHLQQAKEKQKLYHDRGSAACETLPLEIGDKVRIRPTSCKEKWKVAIVWDKKQGTNSYIVESAHGGFLRRNRAHLQKATTTANARAHLENNSGNSWVDEPTQQNTEKLTSEIGPTDQMERVDVSSKAPNSDVIITRSGRVSKKLDRLLMY